MHVSAKSTKPILIGCCGYATAGKDALADALVSECEYIKIGWADKLYEMALKLNPWIWTPIPMKLSLIVRMYGWTKAKRFRAVRKYLQWLGTEIVRDTLGADTWINTQAPIIKQAMADGKNVVVTNCRFENEVRSIRELGGKIVKVSRAGVGPVNSHISDAGSIFQMADYEVENYGTLDELAANAVGLHMSLVMECKAYQDPLHTFQEAVRSGLANGVKMILNTAAPNSVEASEWQKRHRVEGEVGDGRIVVLVDNQEAGSVLYNDGIIEVNAKVAL